MKSQQKSVPYPGIRAALDGNSAVIRCEKEASDGAGAYPITPSTQMGEGWAEAAAQGHLNISGRPLIFIEPEGEHAAAAVTAGLSMSGLRAANFSSGQGIAYMHESLYAAVGKRLTYVLNIGARAMTKAALNVHAGHDDYHCVDDTGFFQLFAMNAQHAADLNVIAHRIAELALTPGIVAQDGFLTTHLIESLQVPERALIQRYLGRPDDMIDCPTPAQRIIYGEQRRRVPELWDVDNPMMAGVVQNQDAYMQSVAAQRPFFFDHIAELAAQAFVEYAELTGRHYAPVMPYRCDDADYLIVGQGSMIPTAQAVADYLRDSRRLKVGVVNMAMFRPFPAAALAPLLSGRKGVVVLERLDQPLAEDLPLMREIRAVVGKCLENGQRSSSPPWPELPTYRSLDVLSPLYSGSFGMGSRDLQPEGLIGAVENMLPDGAHQRRFYLSIDFLKSGEAATGGLSPKQVLHQQTIEAAYPGIEKLAVHGSENPNLMPQGCVTIRFHSVGGWGMITTGKNLAMTLFELLGYHVKANPKYGSEKKGQPTTFYLAAAPEPIRVNSEFFHVDVVLSPDPHVLQHTNALAGLRDGGVFILQSDLKAPDAVWAAIPEKYQRELIERDIRVFYLDAFAIARDEATDPDLQMRMQGIAFQGAFFAASPLMKQAGLDEEGLLVAIRKQLQHKFGGKGARIVEDNLRVVRRGFEELREIDEKRLAAAELTPTQAVGELPILLRDLAPSQAPESDIHGFWERTGCLYSSGRANENLADPFMSLGVMPASSSLFRDMTGIRFHHPRWIPEKCTACGDCYTVCPDTAIPGLVNEIGQIFDTLISRLHRKGEAAALLPAAVRRLEPAFRERLREAGDDGDVRAILKDSITRFVAESDATQDSMLRSEFDALLKELNGFDFALSRPYFGLPEKKQEGAGGLLSITVNPYTCKGCMECVAVCKDNALESTPQTPESIAALRQNWDLWRDLPSTPKKYIRVDDLEEGAGALETILLEKDIYQSFSSGDGACLGCSEKTVVHLFVATVEALMKPRVKKHLADIEELIKRLEQHVRMQLIDEIDIDDTDTMGEVLDSLQADEDLTLAEIAKKVESVKDSHPLDREWLQRMNTLIAGLKKLRWRYQEGTTGHGRSAMGMLNSTGCTSVWGSTWPYNPYPFPWANHLFQDSPSMAMGVFEGHMVKMAAGFKLLREAEQELSGKPRTPAEEERLARLDWQHFTEEEFALCPPVVVLGGDGAMYDIGFQNLSRVMMSGKPLKILVVDTQVYSNTGGQACTSGFMGQVSDMAQFGAAQSGKQEVRKEIGLIGMAHRTTYVMQSTIAHANHMIEGFIQGLKAKRPALFNLYTACQPEHGIADDAGREQARLAVESRAYPLFRYDPAKGKTVAECFDLSGNPAPQDTWPSYEIHYRDGGKDHSLKLPMTFADFAMTEARFRKHFRTAPRDSWHEGMVPLADYLERDKSQREGAIPFIWTVDKEQELGRLLVDESMVQSCEDRRDFWMMLRDMAADKAARAEGTRSEVEIEQDVLARLSSGLLRLVSGSSIPTSAAAAAGAAAKAPNVPPLDGDVASAVSGAYMAPWIDTAECTSCDECTRLNPAIFAYNEAGKAVIQNPQGGPYSDLVKAAEKCTAGVIHPGLPADRSAPDIEKWIRRGEKHNG